ncbi:MAG: Fe-S protein assembly co-chaperone HscB [Bacteroidia bacterium]
MDNFFEFFDFPVQFELDENALRIAYLKNSKNFHPDYHVQDPDKHEEALRITSINNKAYKTLLDEQSRIQHILDLYNVSTEGVKLPPDFLMEMMEINEELMDAKMDDNQELVSGIQKRAEIMKQEMHSKLLNALTQFDDSPQEDKANSLELVKDLFLKMKYMKRLEENLNS